MPYAHLILHTDEYDLDTDIYDHRPMSAYVPICSYICMYPLLLAIHMCLYIWFLHVTYMHLQAEADCLPLLSLSIKLVCVHIQAYMHWPVFSCIVRNICTFS